MRRAGQLAGRRSHEAGADVLIIPTGGGRASRRASAS
jgi:hypothetical protein